MSKKYTAHIDVFDDDYRAWVDTEEHLVDSTAEAEKLAKSLTERPFTYSVLFLVENKAKGLK